jgi:hypothetical protein
MTGKKYKKAYLLLPSQVDCEHPYHHDSEHEYKSWLFLHLCVRVIPGQCEINIFNTQT